MRRTNFVSLINCENMKNNKFYLESIDERGFAIMWDSRGVLIKVPTHQLKSFKRKLKEGNNGI